MGIKEVQRMTILTYEFPNKNWIRRGLEEFQCIRATGSIESALLKIANDVFVRNQDNVFLATRQISRKYGVSRTTVVGIIYNDLLLKYLKRHTNTQLTAANQAHYHHF